MQVKALSVSLVIGFSMGSALAAPVTTDFAAARLACESAAESFIGYVNTAQTWGDNVEGYNEMYAVLQALAEAEAALNGQELNPAKVRGINNLIAVAWDVREASIDETRRTTIDFCVNALVGEHEKL